MKLGVALGWHVHPWEELLSLVRLAEELGYDAAFVDGDVSMLPSRREGTVLDGWTVTTALLAKTRRIAIGSIRLVHHWNAARLAQSLVTLDQIAPGRLRVLVSIGSHDTDARFGLPRLPVPERIRMLDETLAALRALWRGETVHSSGRHVRLEGARVLPVPPGGGLPIAVAAAGPKMLEVVASHADTWEVNLPPVRSRVAAAASHLEKACRARGRSPAEIARSQWIFTRLSDEPDADALRREYRRLNPWFSDLSETELGEALVAGSAEACRRRLQEIRQELALELPVVDLSGLDAASTRRVMEALAPAEHGLTG